MITRVVRVVLDDQQEVVARLISTVVRNRLDRALAARMAKPPAGESDAVPPGPGWEARHTSAAGKLNERAALPAAAQVDFAAEQGRASSRLIGQAPSPVPPYLRLVLAVGLLQGFEYDLLLFQRNADAGVPTLRTRRRAGD
jgi:hypothetical protein